MIDALIYGPGRGNCIIPGDDPLGTFWNLLRMVNYALFFAGAIESVRSPGRACLLLFIGLMGRVVLEYRFSLAVSRFDDGYSPNPTELFLILGFYLISFVFPAMLFLDCLRAWQKPTVTRAP